MIRHELQKLTIDLTLPSSSNQVSAYFTKINTIFQKITSRLLQVLFV